MRRSPPKTPAQNELKIANLRLSENCRPKLKKHLSFGLERLDWGWMLVCEICPANAFRTTLYSFAKNSADISEIYLLQKAQAAPHRMSCIIRGYEQRDRLRNTGRALFSHVASSVAMVHCSLSGQAAHRQNDAGAALAAYCAPYWPGCAGSRRCGCGIS